MTKNDFFHLADTVFDHEANQEEIIHFEQLLEDHPEWMDEWMDQKTALQAIMGIEPIEATPDFTASLTARWQAQKIRHSVRYWTPAALAAVAAAVGLLAVLQVLGTPIENESFGRPEAEARLESTTSVQFPSLSEPSNR